MMEYNFLPGGGKLSSGWLPGLQLQEPAPPLPRIPRLIWSLWDKGVRNAPPMQKTCLWSHRAANPTFRVTHLDMEGAINATGLLDVIEPQAWEKMTIQANMSGQTR